MALDVPLIRPGSISIPANQLDASEQLEALLTVGRVLGVEVAQNPTDPSQIGIKLLGKFLSADLPPDVQIGKRLIVQVLDNTDQVLFKILNRGEQNSSSPELALRAQIQQLLQSIGQEDLKALLSTDLATELNLPQPPDPTAKANPSADKLGQLFEKLLKKGVIINAEKLETPKGLAETLLNLNQKDLLRTLEEAQEALRTIARTAPPPAQTQFLISARSEISNLISELTQEIEAQILAAPEAEVDSDTGEAIAPPILKNLPPTPHTISPTIEKKLTQLLSVIKENKFRFADSPAEDDKEFAKFISETNRELQNSARTKDGNVIKEGLSKALRYITDKLPAEFARIDEGVAQAQIKTVSTLENLMNAQESLNQANKVMGAVGEPIFMLFPFLAGGLFSKLNFTVEPPRIDAEQRRKNGAKGSHGFEKVDLQVNFPGLGPVNVNLAHRKGELYLNLTFNDSNITDFVKERVLKLEERFKEHGFEEPTLSLATGEAQDITPEWLKQLVGQHSVVA